MVPVRFIGTMTDRWDENSNSKVRVTGFTEHRYVGPLHWLDQAVHIGPLSLSGRVPASALLSSLSRPQQLS